MTNTKGMIIDGLFASEALDSSGEIVSISGMDITDFTENRGLANYEHVQPGKKKDDEKQIATGQEKVGKIIYAKKIFSLKDCDNERQKKLFKEAGEVPCLYGIVRLFDAAGHEGAKALAAQIRDSVVNKEPLILGFSIEGATLKRDGNRIVESISRLVAVTAKACNKTCKLDLLEDPQAPEGFDKQPAKESKDILANIVENLKSEQDPTARRLGGHESLYTPFPEDMHKALEAGTGNAAPSALTQGAALQREDLGKDVVHGFWKNQALAALKEYDAKNKDKPFNKSEFLQFAKAKLPDASDEFLEHFSNIAENYTFKVRKPLHKSTLDLVLKLDTMYIDLQKAVQDLAPYELPKIYDVNSLSNGLNVGKFVVHQNQLHILHDHTGVLATKLHQGPMDEHNILGIHDLEFGPDMQVKERVLPVDANGGTITPEVSTPALPPAKPSVFQYFRVGMEKPHVLEVINKEYLLDGNKLSNEEVQAIMQDLSNNVGTLRYHNAEDLNKAEVEGAAGTTLEDILRHVQSGATQGFFPANIHETLSKEFYQDSLTGLGNQCASQAFLQKAKPGIYMAINVNSLDALNVTYGYNIGNQALVAIAKAMQNAADETSNIKVFRTQGDSFMVWAPSVEHAHKFARILQKRLDNIPHVGGTHKISLGIGIGNDMETAIQALAQAKGTFDGGHCTYSLVPGQEGSIPTESV